MKLSERSTVVGGPVVADLVHIVRNAGAGAFTSYKAPISDILGLVAAVPDEVVGGKITIASSAPASPATGDVWIDTT